jgi:hypothetical protein
VDQLCGLINNNNENVIFNHHGQKQDEEKAHDFESAEVGYVIHLGRRQVLWMISLRVYLSGSELNSIFVADVRTVRGERIEHSMVCLL